MILLSIFSTILLMLALKIIDSMISISFVSAVFRIGNNCRDDFYAIGDLLNKVIIVRKGCVIGRF